MIVGSARPPEQVGARGNQTGPFSSYIEQKDDRLVGVRAVFVILTCGVGGSTNDAGAVKKGILF